MGSSIQGYCNARLEELASRIKDYPLNNENEFQFWEDVRRTVDDIWIDCSNSSEVTNNPDWTESLLSYMSTSARSYVLRILNTRQIFIETGDLSGVKRTGLAKVLMAEAMKRKRAERDGYLIRLYENPNILNDMLLKEVESMEEREWKKEEIDDHLIWFYENPNILIDMALEEVESMEKMNNRRTSMQSAAANQVNYSGKNSMMGMGGTGTTYITNRDSTIINHYHNITIK